MDICIVFWWWGRIVPPTFLEVSIACCFAGGGDQIRCCNKISVATFFMAKG